jgi:hypothetical protein
MVPGNFVRRFRRSSGDSAVSIGRNEFAERNDGKGESVPETKSEEKKTRAWRTGPAIFLPKLPFSSDWRQPTLVLKL